MKIGNKNIIIITFVISLLFFLLIIGFYVIKPSLPKKIMLIDKNTNKPLYSVDVYIFSDSGIRCITAPCPSGPGGWYGKSNQSGYIYIPSKYVNPKLHSISIQAIKTGGGEGALGIYAKERIFLNQGNAITIENWIIKL